MAPFSLPLSWSFCICRSCCRRRERRASLSFSVFFFIFFDKKKTKIGGIWGCLGCRLSWVVGVGRIYYYEYDAKVEKHCFWEDFRFIRSCKINIFLFLFPYQKALIFVFLGGRSLSIRLLLQNWKTKFWSRNKKWTCSLIWIVWNYTCCG